MVDQVCDALLVRGRAKDLVCPCGSQSLLVDRVLDAAERTGPISVTLFRVLPPRMVEAGEERAVGLARAVRRARPRLAAGGKRKYITYRDQISADAHDSLEAVSWGCLLDGYGGPQTRRYAQRHPWPKARAVRSGVRDAWKLPADALRRRLQHPEELVLQGALEAPLGHPGPSLRCPRRLRAVADPRARRSMHEQLAWAAEASGQLSWRLGPPARAQRWRGAARAARDRVGRAGSPRQVGCAGARHRSGPVDPPPGAGSRRHRRLRGDVTSLAGISSSSVDRCAH